MLAMPPFKTLALIAVIFVGISVGSVSAIDKYCNQTFKMSSAGYGHSLGLLSNGTLLSWGDGTVGQLGLGPNKTTTRAPEVISSAKKWIFTAAGTHSSFGIKEDGTLWAFGDGWDGKLGYKTKEDQFVPVQIGNDTDWMTISATRSHTLGLKKNGSLYAWGDINQEKTGHPILVPTAVLPEKSWNFISAGPNHSFAIDTNGSLWGWGWNKFGQLGDGTTKEKWVPTQLISKNKWKSVSCGHAHTVALDDKGHLYVWGNNTKGQLGDGSILQRLVPTLIKSKTWTSVIAGAYYSMGIDSKGTLFGWGSNDQGQLGDNSKTNRTKPVKVDGKNLAPWKQIAVSTDHSLGISKDGLLFSWGRSHEGRLGLGVRLENQEDRITPGVCHGKYVCLKGVCAPEPSGKRLLRSFLKW